MADSRGLRPYVGLVVSEKMHRRESDVFFRRCGRGYILFCSGGAGFGRETGNRSAGAKNPRSRRRRIPSRPVGELSDPWLACVFVFLLILGPHGAHSTCWG